MHPFFVKKRIALAIALLLAGCVCAAALMVVGTDGNWKKSGFEGFFGELKLPLDGEARFDALEQAVVARVIDGDTLELEGGERVRLIGIDTPEKGEECFEEAKKGLERLVLGRSVLLAKDVSERDKYGRLVRFVYLDGLLVNLVLVEEGFAHSFEYNPDTSLAPAFRESEARASVKGGCLWPR
jgi:micrococcal nuclease